MKIKNLFTVPHGEKVTEKHLRRVLIASICSILLCMTCLVSTTWAWFTVELNNQNNMICIGNWSLDIKITECVSDGAMPVEEGGSQEQPDPIQPSDGKYSLGSGRYLIDLSFSSDGSFGKDVPVYVVMKQTFEGKAESIYNYTVLTYSEAEKVWTVPQMTYTANSPVELTFWVTRTDPYGTPMETEQEDPTEETTEPSTEATEPSSETTEPSTEATEPSTEATEPSTETTEPSTEATEPSTEATEPSTATKEPSTEATESVTEVTEASTETPTENVTESTGGSEVTIESSGETSAAS